MSQSRADTVPELLGDWDLRDSAVFLILSGEMTWASWNMASWSPV